MTHQLQHEQENVPQYMLTLDFCRSLPCKRSIHITITATCRSQTRLTPKATARETGVISHHANTVLNTELPFLR